MVPDKLLQEISTLKEKNQSLAEKNRQLEQKANYLQFQVKEYQRMIFGSKSERFVARAHGEGQMELPFKVEEKPAQDPVPTEEITYTRKKEKRDNHPGRFPLPDHLPVEEIILEPKEDTSGFKCIGKEVTDKLELVPAKLFIKRYIRPKYIKPEDEHELNSKGIIAELPSFPIEKAIAGAGLLSQIAVDKYVDHLPIYRQIQRYSREGIRIPANTINGWQDGIATLISPLFERHKQLVMGQGYLQADESPIKVLDKKTKGKTHTGFYWVYNSPLQHALIYDYRHGRGREGPGEMLQDFKGYLQSDGYKVYDWFGKKKEITLLNCWAHTRRYFEKAKDSDRKAATHALTQIQKLYMIERFAKTCELTPAERKTLRLDHALPILNDFSKWMVEQVKSSLPKSPIGKALEYAIPRWDNLLAYLYDGHLEIDNNLVENAIRPLAIGRKNYLFAGSHDAAKRAAMFYSFFGTCKRHNINPYEWLKDVLERIPEHKANKLDELLPQNWQKLKDNISPE